MECPNCGKDSVAIVHEDPILCTKCGSTMIIKYCVCTECNYTFRLNNNMLLDGGVVEYEMIDEALEEIIDAMDREMEEDESLLDLIHPCVRCGSPTAYRISETEYMCPECGMEWEILIHG